MLAFWLRAGLSGLIVALIATIARRNPVVGALVAALPLVSILGMLWLWNDTRDVEGMARHMEATFWYVLPSLPMFLVMPWALRQGAGFWQALAGGCALTVALYLLTIIVAARFGVRL